MGNKVLILTLFAVFASGCSMKNAEDRKLRLGISLARQDAPQLVSNLTSPDVFLSSLTGGLFSPVLKTQKKIKKKNRSNDIGITSVPTPEDMTDFNCFAVNVTGSGIPNQNNIGHGATCTLYGRFLETGVGFLSDLVDDGDPIELLVTTGKGRNVDVYGVWPQSEPCEHDDEWYNGFPVIDDIEPIPGGYGFLLGSKSVDVIDNVNVTVPVSFDPNTTASIECLDQDSVMLNLLPRSQDSPYDNEACNDNATALPSACTNISAQEYYDISDGYDGDTGITMSSGPTGFSAQFDVDHIDLTTYKYMKIHARMSSSGGSVVPQYFDTTFQTLSWDQAPTGTMGYVSTVTIDISSVLPLGGSTINGREKLIIGFNNSSATFDLDAIYVSLSKNNY